MPPSSSDEIARQHAEAMLLVYGSDEHEGHGKLEVMKCSTRQRLGEINLDDKLQPTATLVGTVEQKLEDQKRTKERESESNDDRRLRATPSSTVVSNCKLKNPMCFSTRGVVDVATLQNMIRLGHDVQNYQKDDHGDNGKENKKYSPVHDHSTVKKCQSAAQTCSTKSPSKDALNYWDPENARTFNVDITRPSHDGWGIGKIVLVFSDDFLTKVYHLPWWKEFQPHVQPILDLLENNHRQQDSLEKKVEENAASTITTEDDKEKMNGNGCVNDDCQMNGTENNPSRRLVVVRALFASLPPGVTIPVHNDSGEWVKTTHRVHVPILVEDPTKILFRCGPTPETLQRIDCTPGHVFEINNQAKHAVSNCDPDHSRVHLILDYVVLDDNDIEQVQGDKPSMIDTSILDAQRVADDHGAQVGLRDHTHQQHQRRSLLTPIVLDAGERLVQTRRSIDRMIDIRQRPTPSYIILGAQKAGTTSLYDYINQHPWVVKARRRETHCLDWRWEQQTTPAKQLGYCRKFFYTEELEDHPSCLTGDSTPSYLLDSRRVIPRIRSTFSTWKMKFFVMMRDPVRRAASHYAMVTSTVGTPAQLKTRGFEWREMTMRQVIELEMEKMDRCGLIPYWQPSPSGTFVGGSVDQDAFDRFAGSTAEDDAWTRYLTKYVPLNTGSYGLLTRGMYAVQLRPWLRAFDRDQVLCLKLESWKSNGVQSTMDQVWAHLDLPYHPVHDASPKNTREYSTMEPELQDHLQTFFEPHNRILASVVQTDDQDDQWVNPWPYDDAIA